VDGGVSPAVRAEGVRVLSADGRGLERQLQREVAERADARLEIGDAKVVQRVLGQLVGCALGTEVVGVRASSVVAVVRVRDDDREELALDARKLGRAEHDRLVELHRPVEHAWVQAHRLDDVEDLPRTPDRSRVLLGEIPGGLVDLDQPDVRHALILP
jgi:hypothetical protein